MQNIHAFEVQKGAKPLESRELIAEGEMLITGSLPSMAAGLYGYFGYDMIRHQENISDNNPSAFKYI